MQEYSALQRQDSSSLYAKPMTFPKSVFFALWAGRRETLGKRLDWVSAGVTGFKSHVTGNVSYVSCPQSNYICFLERRWRRHYHEAVSC